MSNAISLQDVESAYSLARTHLIRTPLVYSPEFSEITGSNIFFKLESFQRTHAFKVRGALNKLWSLSQAEKERGVIAASSGNHGLGVAYASSLLGVDAIIVMPTTAADTKIGMAEQYGARVVLHGKYYDDALEHAKILAAEEQRPLLSGFDDLMVIAGSGAIALEVLEDLPDVDLFLGPIGGGGLIAGLAVTLSELGHHAAVIGVQAQGAPSMYESLKKGERVRLAHVETIADGIAVRQPGVHNFEIARRHVKEVLTVSDEQIQEAMQRMLTDVRVIIELPAAAPVAALLFDERLHNLDRDICCVITGGNISRLLLRSAVEADAPSSDV